MSFSLLLKTVMPNNNSLFASSDRLFFRFLLPIGSIFTPHVQQQPAGSDCGETHVQGAGRRRLSALRRTRLRCRADVGSRTCKHLLNIFLYPTDLVSNDFCQLIIVLAQKVLQVQGLPQAFGFD